MYTYIYIHIYMYVYMYVCLKCIYIYICMLYQNCYSCVDLVRHYLSNANCLMRPHFFSTALLV